MNIIFKVLLYQCVMFSFFFSVKYLYIFTGMPVPIAIIVCEGDLNTISEITEALKHKLPVIIMKGSGKAADLVLDFIDR